MKKTLFIIAVIFGLFLVLFFFPNKVNRTVFNEDCESYCKEIENTIMYGLECQLPFGGCYGACFGFTVNKQCSRRSKCFNACEMTCLGINLSPCGPNFLEKKINYFKSDLDE